MKLKFEINNPKKTLSFISTFASKIAHRPVLTYFNVLIKDGLAKIQMTDSYKLIHLVVGEVEDKELEFNKCFDTEFMSMIAKSLSTRRFMYYMYIDTESGLVGFGEDKEINIRWTSPMDGTYPKLDHILGELKDAHVYEEKIEQYLGMRFTRGFDRHFKIEVPDINGPIILNVKPIEDFIKFARGTLDIKLYCTGEIRPVVFEFQHDTLVFQCLYLPIRTE